MCVFFQVYFVVGGFYGVYQWFLPESLHPSQAETWQGFVVGAVLVGIEASALARGLNPRWISISDDLKISPPAYVLQAIFQSKSSVVVCDFRQLQLCIDPGAQLF